MNPPVDSGQRALLLAGLIKLGMSRPAGLTAASLRPRVDYVATPSKTAYQCTISNAPMALGNPTATHRGRGDRIIMDRKGPLTPAVSIFPYLPPSGCPSPTIRYPLSEQFEQLQVDRLWCAPSNICWM